VYLGCSDYFEEAIIPGDPKIILYMRQFPSYIRVPFLKPLRDLEFTQVGIDPTIIYLSHLIGLSVSVPVKNIISISFSYETPKVKYI
jgi:hypothetical protein